MRQVIINRYYEMKNGTLSGVIGKVVGYDSIENEVTLRVDPVTCITTISENIELVEEFK